GARLRQTPFWPARITWSLAGRSPTRPIPAWRRRPSWQRCKPRSTSNVSRPRASGAPGVAFGYTCHGYLRRWGAHDMFLTRKRTTPLLSMILLALPLAAASLQVTKPEEVGLSADRLKRINELIDRRIAAGDISGAVTLVARRGRVVHFEAQGLANIDAKKPMSKDAVFRLASMSKPVTGVAIMMLVEEGKIRLTDPVSRYIPEFKGLKVAVPQQIGRAHV